MRSLSRQTSRSWQINCCLRVGFFSCTAEIISWSDCWREPGSNWLRKSGETERFTVNQKHWVFKTVGNGKHAEQKSSTRPAHGVARVLFCPSSGDGDRH